MSASQQDSHIAGILSIADTGSAPRPSSSASSTSSTASTASTVSASSPHETRPHPSKRKPVRLAIPGLPTPSTTTTAAPKMNCPPNPAWKHADQILTRLDVALRAHPRHPTPTHLANEGTVTADNNISLMAAFVRATRAQLRRTVPPDLPSLPAVDEAWEAIQARCVFIDAGINGNAGDFDAVAHTYPGEEAFQAGDKELASLLVVGLEDLRYE